MLAQEVMDRVASLMNDTARTSYTYEAQVPYINMAADELKEALEENGAPVTIAVSTVLDVPIGVFDVGVNGPSLPAGLIDVISVWERSADTNDSFIEVKLLNALPKTGVLTNELLNYTWNGEIINFLGANSNREVKIDYIKSVIDEILDETSLINVINSKSFLSYRTAALCSQFIGENKTRSDDLNAMAILALDRCLNIKTKGRQAIVTRRRPFKRNSAPY